MKTKKLICFILSLLLTVPCFCFASCDSSGVGDIGDIGGLETLPEDEDREQESDEPYIAPAKLKELAKDETVYRAGMYTGYSIIIRTVMNTDNGVSLGSNLSEVLLDDPGEYYPVHEDPTCSHDTARCPTAAESIADTTIIVEQESGQPLIFYFGRYNDNKYDEDGNILQLYRVYEIRCYDVETGEITTVSKLALDSIADPILYKGKIYFSNRSRNMIGMVDIITGKSKLIEDEDLYTDYGILGVKNDRLYYLYVFDDEDDDELMIQKNRYVLKSLSLDLDDERTEYDLGELVSPRAYLTTQKSSYMNGDMLYILRNFRFACDPWKDTASDALPILIRSDFDVCDIYALDLNNISAGEKLIVEGALKIAWGDGKLYYTLVDYKEVGEVSSSDTVYDSVTDKNSSYIKMFGSTDGGTLYEYDLATGDVREVCKDSGYNIVEIFEVTDDGKMFFRGRDYVNFVRADEGNYRWMSDIGKKDYCMLDLSTGEVTELYAPLYLEELEDDFIEDDFIDR